MTVTQLWQAIGALKAARNLTREIGASTHVGIHDVPRHVFELMPGKATDLVVKETGEEFSSKTVDGISIYTTERE